MKTSHLIIALYIANSFFLTSVGSEKKFIGIKTYWPERAVFNPNTRQTYYSHGPTYNYCLSSWAGKETRFNCAMINAYVLLNRRPQESVEEQLAFYKNDLETTTKQIDSMPNKFNLDPETDIFKKNRLIQRQAFLQTIIPQIELANLSGNVQDNNIREQVGNALHNIGAYNQQELKELETAAQKAPQCNFLDTFK
jgi:hypothetical protein